MPSKTIKFWTLWTVLLGPGFCVSTPHCKVTPDSPRWPTQAQWQSLNASVSGQLRATSPPGAVCHPDQPAYEPSACAETALQWRNSSWHASNPWSVDFNDETCRPNASFACSSAGYPAYGIEALTSDQVSVGAKFAQDHGLRLVVKGTGHDFLGRSSAPGALSIWTHQLRGIDINYDDARAKQYGGVASAKVAAGLQWGEVYREMIKHNLTIVGGADLNVGVGGWTLGGGHSPVSAYYGLGADQVLEMEVVTFSGSVLTINETSHSDLFWAMRGGGPGFAIVTSITYKVYPGLPSTQHSLTYITSPQTDTFWYMVAYFHSQIPAISSAGGMGYYFALPDEGIFAGIFLFPNRTVEETRSTMTTIESYLTPSPAPPWANNSIAIDSSTTSSTNVLAAWYELTANGNPNDGVGGSTRLASRLLDAAALSSSSLHTLKRQLQKSTPAPWPMLGHVIAGPGTADAHPAGGENAVHPAWRRALTHIVLPRGWPASSNASGIAIKNQVTAALREDALPALTALAPDMGAYMSESDPTNPRWKADYFGPDERYARLLAVKKKYDPAGVFWCKPCVGHEEWEVVNHSAGADHSQEAAQEARVEWGVGQTGLGVGSGGRLCRKADSTTGATDL